MGLIKDDLTGQRFGRFIVLEYVESDKRGHTKWRCRCDCGNEKVVLGSNLKTGRTTSCGCYHKEQHTTHGFSTDPLYNTWKSMCRRCEDEKDRNYRNYGGRGIRVCDEWQDFESFRYWSKNNGYDSELSIDRIDVNGDYEPENCRWADWLTQSNNKRTNRFYTYNGVTHTVAEWSRILNVNYGTLLNKINRNNTYDFIEYYKDELYYGKDGWHRIIRNEARKNERKMDTI